MPGPEDLVECYSGGQYAERPTALYWDGQRLPVDEVLQSWRTLEGRRFLVQAAGQVFVLDYNEYQDEWRIHSC